MKKGIHKGPASWFTLTLFIFMAASLINAQGIIIEVESVDPVGSWKLQTDIDGYSGDGYFWWSTGNAYGSPPQNSVLEYPFSLSESGKYKIGLRCIRNYNDDCPDDDKSVCNDVHMAIDDGEYDKKMASPHVWNQWVWDPGWHGPALNISAGDHILKITGRSQQVKIDAIEIYLEGNDPPGGGPGIKGGKVKVSLPLTGRLSMHVEKEHIIVNASGGEHHSLILYHVSGEQADVFSLQSGKSSFSLTNLKSGLYFAEVRALNGEILHSRKIMIMR